MIILNEYVDLVMLKKLTESEEFNFWIHPRYVTGFEVKDVEESERNYIDSHNSILVDDESGYEMVITYYLTGCLIKDSFQSDFKIPYMDFISAGLYLISDLYSTHTAYPFAWNGSYLINENNCARVFLEINKIFHQVENNHVKNLLRVFCVELLDEFCEFLGLNEKLKYNEIKDFKTEFTYMY